MKSFLRREALKKRNSMTNAEVEKKSEKIKENLFRTDEFAKAKVIMFYVSKDYEVKTKGMIESALNNGKKTVVPVTEKTNRNLIASEIKSYGELHQGVFDILEPKREIIRVVDPKEIDLVIVPGIVFDKNGTRIGYGHGYYDNFLKNVRKDTDIIALAYEFQVVDKIPTQDGDIPVNKIVTENGVIGCKSNQ